MQRMKDLAAEYAYLVMLVCVIAVIGGSAAYTKKVRELPRETLVEAAAGAPEVEETGTPAAEIRTTPLPTIAPIAVRMSVLAQKSVWPVDGQTIRHHELQTPVFWEALGAWQTHAGIDIAGAAQQIVRSAADGVVRNVTRDVLWGGSVEVEQEDGRLIVYRGLALCCLQQGERVSCGEEIGTLLEHIPCEAELGAHLHMEAVRGGVFQDPIAMLPER